MARAPQTAPATLQVRRTFQAPRAKVFQAWTEAQALKRWSAPGDFITPLADVDLRVGGRYRIHMQAPDGTLHKVTGTYRVVDPPKKLVYTWFWETKAEDGETLVTVEFHERGRGTEVVLTHELFPNDEARKSHEMGWTACFEKLATLLEGRE